MLVTEAELAQLNKCRQQEGKNTKFSSYELKVKFGNLISNTFFLILSLICIFTLECKRKEECLNYNCPQYNILNIFV